MLLEAGGGVTSNLTNACPVRASVSELHEQGWGMPKKTEVKRQWKTEEHERTTPQTPPPPLPQQTLQPRSVRLEPVLHWYMRRSSIGKGTTVVSPPQGDEHVFEFRICYLGMFEGLLVFFKGLLLLLRGLRVVGRS
jgi:hypothetical protein